MEMSFRVEVETIAGEDATVFRGIIFLGDILCWSDPVNRETPDEAHSIAMGRLRRRMIKLFNLEGAKI